MVKINERVGAICSADNTSVNMFGYGVYLGDVIPETDDVKMFGLSLKEIQHPNPCILLDSGKKVYGCECWWGPEEVIKTKIAGREIIEVDIEEMRAKSNAVVERD